MAGVQRVLGLDPGLRHTGWGVIETDGYRLRHLGHGVVGSDGNDELAQRLLQLYRGLVEVVEAWSPDQAAVEETFVNKNPVSTLKLGQARGIALLVPAAAGLPVAEYAPNLIKKTVVGSGHAGKEQIRAMMAVLLPGARIDNEHAADALAVAICHAHHRGPRQVAAAGLAAALR
ncbi:crossover junction endodeoxyribonuclease RuvC [Oceanibacterium hippocampi]|uniref:Crossover junction endodeoxyribonuclease RuvC n=1 Tax=Oceanibacterium hippocampi TaxID=745714 RepID=A0A1Y5TUL9_9PROT|nr:crossover junction endodeoxyribonuclease RuvC [Oceanibacterium hippocampi]SLN73383.1 Crossover junction endodeoxyribonuclease RuvC [Oceanibacterium hippocampi]